MIFGLAGAATPSASVDCHLRLGRWIYVENERRRAEVDGRTSCLQHRAAAWDGTDMVARLGRRKGENQDKTKRRRRRGKELAGAKKEHSNEDERKSPKSKVQIEKETRSGRNILLPSHDRLLLGN